MDTADAAPTAGIVACLGLLLALAAPYVLVGGPESPLGVYYGSGIVGIGGAAFIAAVLVVVLLSGKQGRTDPDTIAGIAVVAGLALFAIALTWALAVDREVLFNFPPGAEWIVYHRWVVLALSALVPASAGVYARAVL